MCKFFAKADSIYMMKLTKTFLKTSVIFWSHLTQIFKTDEVKEEKKSYETNNHKTGRDSIVLLFTSWKQVKQKIIKFEIIQIK